MRSTFLAALVGGGVLVSGAMALLGAQSPQGFTPPKSSPPVYPGKSPFAAPPRILPPAPPEQPPVYVAPSARTNVVETPPFLVNLVKRVPARVAVGDTFTCEIKVLAQGDVADVVVTDHVPAGASYVASSPPGTLEDGRLTWKIASLARGASRTLKITLKAEKVGELSTAAAVTATPVARVNITVGR